MTTARHGPIDATAPARLPSVPAHVRRLGSTLESAAVRVRSGHDGEAIHDLRVATRRLSAALSTWAPGLELTARQRASRGLRRLRRRLSRAREREVLGEQLAGRCAGESLAVRQVGLTELERLERRVAAARARAARDARRRRIGRLVVQVEGCFDSLAGEPVALIAAARERADRRRDAALDALASAAEGDDEALHRARAAVKRWRYAVEALAEGAGDPRGTGLHALRGLQQCLGAIHDAAVLRDYLSRRALRAGAKGRGEHLQSLAWLREKAVQARWRALEGLPAAAASVGAPRSA